MVGQGNLLRVLGIGFALAMVIGGSVGQGIMRSPGIVAGAMQHAWLIVLVWLVGGLLSSFDAFAVAELAASHPRNGGAYVFTRRALGPFMGVMTAWTDFINFLLANAYVSVVFAEYIHRLGLATAWPAAWLAGLLLLVCGAINATGTRASGASQNLGTLAKCAMLTAMIVLLFMAPRAETPQPSILPQGAIGIAAFAIALRSTIVTYSGWNNAAYFCEEVSNPERTIVRALFGGLAAVTILYVLINVALLQALTPAEMAASNFPAADALQKAYGGFADSFTTGLALVSLFAVANLGVMVASRVPHALASDGALPQSFARVHRNGTPQAALALTLIGSITLAVGGTYESLIAAAAVISQLVLIVLDWSAIHLRIKEPDLPRPFKMPLFPLPAVLGILINLALVAAMVWESPRDSLVGVGILVSIAMVYGAIRPTRWQKDESAA